MFALTHLLGWSCVHFCCSPNLTFPFLMIDLLLLLLVLVLLVSAAPLLLFHRFLFSPLIAFTEQTIKQVEKVELYFFRKISLIHSTQDQSQSQKNLSPTLPLIRSDLHNWPCPRQFPLTTSETCSIWLRCVKSPSSQLFFFKPFHEPPCCKIHSQEEEVHYILASENGKIATTGKMWEIRFCLNFYLWMSNSKV